MNKTERIARSILSKITLHPEEAKRKGIQDAKQFCDDPTWVRNIQKDYDRFCYAEGSELSKGSFKLYQKAALEELKKRGKIFASKSDSIAKELLAIAKSLTAESRSVDEKKERQLFKECMKYCKTNDNKGSIEIRFDYNKWDGIKTYIGFWSGGDGDSFDKAIAGAKERVKILEQAKKDYAKLVALQKELGLPGDTKKM